MFFHLTVGKAQLHVKTMSMHERVLVLCMLAHSLLGKKLCSSAMCWASFTPDEHLKTFYYAVRNRFVL